MFLGQLLLINNTLIVLMETQKDTIPTKKEVTQEQRDSVLTPDQTPSWSWGLTLLLIALGSLIIFAGFYYGIINV